jgi:hypothetical protein
MIITVAGVQESVISRSTTLAGSDEPSTQFFTNIASKNVGQDSLRKYYAISALSLGERKASFRNASAHEKSDLWRTHLALFLVKHQELNESQKEVVLAAMSLATPEFFEIRSSDSSWKTKVGIPLRSLEQRIVAAFSSADAAKIFATLGDDTEFTNDIAACAGPALLKSLSDQPLGESDKEGEKGKGKESEKEKEKEKGQEKQAEGGNQIGLCQCAVDSDFCPVATICFAGGCKTQSGCGIFWSYPCNGLCR